ncbi:DUF4240 domain-containing protein [Streptomyces sp. KY70]
MLSGMNENAFWQLIEACSPSTPAPEGDELASALTAAHLTNGPVSGVTGFAEQLSWALYRLDRRGYGDDLSSDQFLYTRAAVVAAGREEYESVLRAPRGSRRTPTTSSGPRPCSTYPTTPTGTSPVTHGTAAPDTATSPTPTLPGGPTRRYRRPPSPHHVKRRLKGSRPSPAECAQGEEPHPFDLCLLRQEAMRPGIGVRRSPLPRRKFAL